MTKLKFMFGVGASMALAASSFGAEVVPGEFIAKLKGSEKSDVLNTFSNVSVKEQIRLSYGNVFVLKAQTVAQMDSIQKELLASGRFEYVEPNFVYRLVKPKKEVNLTSFFKPAPSAPANMSLPADPRFGELWGLRNTGNNEPNGSAGVVGADIDALRAWEITKGSKNVKIAVIDTGIDYNHPDLRENMWVNEAEANGLPGVDDDGNGFIDDIHGYDFANRDGDPMDGHSHGTHCAGTIGAVHDNGEGIAGVMSDVTFVAVKFLSDGGSGTTADAIRAIDYATSLNVDIMSNSWGGGGYSEALKESIERANEKGIYFVAAAGNSSADNDRTPHYPSNYNVPNVVSVAAHTAQDDLASFSCYGRTTVHIAAPGHRVLSAVKGGGYAVYSGTSMATPHVSGALGLLVANEGRLGVEEMKERLMATSEPIRAYRRRTVAGGRLNAYNLLTDTRPSRSEPDPSRWEDVALDEVFESAHPYGHNQTLSREVSVPGAKYLRVVVARYDLETGYDFLKVRNASRAVVESFSGEGTDYATDYIEGDTVFIEFTSDSSVARWGFRIEKVQVIRE